MKKIKTDKKIAFVFSYFSYLRAFSNIRKIFSDGEDISFIHYKINPSENYYDSSKIDPRIKIKEINNFEELEKFDLIFLGFGGKDLENAIVNINSDKCKIITLFPGIRNPNDYNGLISRASSDIILFNNKKDFQDYKNLGNNLNFDTSNGFLFGFPNLIEIKDFSKNDDSNKLCFVAQNEILTKADKLYLLDKFIGFCELSPNKEIIILEKSRRNVKEAHSDDFSYEKLLNSYQSDPKNLKISYEKLEEIFGNCGQIFSISSAAIIESINNKIKTSLVSDFGISEKLGNACYINSGLFMSLEDILSGKDVEVNNSWFNEYIINPKDNIEEFGEILQKPKEKIFNQQFFWDKIKIDEAIKLKKKEEINNLGFFDKATRRVKKFINNPSLYLKDSKYSALNKLGKIIYGR
jgi:hypothetical protein